jgi:hypothetical protein
MPKTASTNACCLITVDTSTLEIQTVLCYTSTYFALMKIIDGCFCQLTHTPTLPHCQGLLWSIDPRGTHREDQLALWRRRAFILRQVAQLFPGAWGIGSCTNTKLVQIANQAMIFSPAEFLKSQKVDDVYPFHSLSPPSCDSRLFLTPISSTGLSQS